MLGQLFLLVVSLLDVVVIYIILGMLDDHVPKLKKETWLYWGVRLVLFFTAAGHLLDCVEIFWDK